MTSPGTNTVENGSEKYDVGHIMVGITEIKGIVNVLNVRMANYEREIDRLFTLIEQHDTRIAKLEKVEQQREGAATTIRVLWAIIGAVSAVVMYVLSNYFQSGSR